MLSIFHSHDDVRLGRVDVLKMMSNEDKVR